jgi:hypothetical protein
MNKFPRGCRILGSGSYRCSRGFSTTSCCRCYKSFFSSSLTKGHNKLERLSFESVSSLIQYVGVRLVSKGQSKLDRLSLANLSKLVKYFRVRPGAYPKLEMCANIKLVWKGFREKRSSLPVPLISVT